MSTEPVAETGEQMNTPRILAVPVTPSLEKELEETHDDTQGQPHYDQLSIAPTSPSATDIERALYRQQSTMKKPYLSLLGNHIFWARIVMILITSFMTFLSILYSISQILSLQFSDEYWCPIRTLEEVRAHSIEYGLEQGDVNDYESCWRANIQSVDRNQLWSTDNYTYQMNYTPSSILKFSALLIVCIGFTILLMHSTGFFIKDIIKYRMGTLGKKPVIREIQYAIKDKLEIHVVKTSKSRCKNILKTCSKYVQVYILWYTKNYGIDTAYWVFKSIFKEGFEVLFMTAAMLSYNGYNIFDRDNVNLAYESQYIILFAIMLCINCMLVFITWILYAFKPNMCFGLTFELTLYGLDSVCDIFYAMYPVIIAFNYDNSSWLTALASLQSDDNIKFIAAFFPMLVLLRKCWSLSRRSRRAMRKYYGNKFYINNPNPKKLETELARFQTTPSSPGLYTSTKNKPTWGVGISPANPKRTATDDLTRDSLRQLTVTYTISWIITPSKYLRKQVKSAILVFISIIFAIYGCVELVVVLDHFSESEPYCSLVVDNIDSYYESRNLTIDINDFETVIAERPELFLWDHCWYKVYPFGTRKRCDCRKFRVDFYSIDSSGNWSDIGVKNVDLYYDIEEVFNTSLHTILNGVLSKFTMIELFEWGHLGYLQDPPLNLTADKFKTKHMRVAAFRRIGFGYIDPAISNWEYLAYLEFDDIKDFPQLPTDSMSQLKQLQSFDMTPYAFTEFPTWLCNLPEIRVISIRLAGILNVPQCILNLQYLLNFNFHGATVLTSIPIELFNVNNLEDFNIAYSRITIESMMEGNNISSISEFDAEFRWKPDVRYFCQHSLFCDDSYLQDVQIAAPNFYGFVNQTGCCEVPCETDSLLGSTVSGLCRADNWRDGVCDWRCDTKECHYDGGDCLQFCECWEEYELLGDGICHQKCNTTNCNYDEHDCLIDIVADGLNISCSDTYEDHGCKIDWINDGWCDQNCRDIEECSYDGPDDCDGCNGQCATIYEIFKLPANSITQDEHIEEDEICNEFIWNTVIGLGYGHIFNNCSDFVISMDLNGDQTIGLYEAMIGLYNVSDLSWRKVQQVDCRACVGSSNYY